MNLSETSPTPPPTPYLGGILFDILLAGTPYPMRD